MTLFQCSRCISSMGAPQEVPALLMRMSMRPKVARVASTTAWTSAGFFTSQPSARVFTPSFFNSSAARTQRSFFSGTEDQVGSHFGESFGHLATKSDGAAGDDGGAPGEVEEVLYGSHGACQCGAPRDQ